MDALPVKSKENYADLATLEDEEFGQRGLQAAMMSSVVSQLKHINELIRGPWAGVLEAR